VLGARLDFACRESRREGRDKPGDSKNRPAGILPKHSGTEVLVYPEGVIGSPQGTSYISSGSDREAPIVTVSPRG